MFNKVGGDRLIRLIVASVLLYLSLFIYSGSMSGAGLTIAAVLTLSSTVFWV